MFILIKEDSEIEQLSILAKEIWNQHYSPIIGRDQVDYMIKLLQSKEAIKEDIEKKDYQYYFIDKNNKKIGYFAIVSKDNSLFLSKLYIKASNRGDGIGKSVINFITLEAKNRDLNKISLTVNKYNENSIEFYKKNGFIIVDSIIFDLGEGYFMDDYKMELSNI